MKRGFLVPVSLAVAGLFARGGSAAPTPVLIEPQRDAAHSGSHLLQRLVALPRTLAAGRPTSHYSHSSHSSHVSHASHTSHFSSSTPPPPPPSPPASGGSSGATSKKGYAQATDVETALQTHGISYRGRHVAITSASCIGESKYGARYVSYVREYHRFNCDVFDSNSNGYNVEIVITKSNATTFWWRVLKVQAL